MKTSDVTGDLAANLASLRAGAQVRKGPACSVSTALLEVAEREPDQLDEVRACLDSPRVSATLLAATLTKAGYPVKPQAISRHRRRTQVNGCRCEA